MMEELKTFVAVVEQKNFTKAAEAVHLSQPSVSLHIKHLEEYFGTLLIQRSVKQKTIHITDSGMLLYHRAKEILRILEETRSDLLDKSETLKGKLRIGASFTIGEYFLPALLGQFSKQHPDLELEVVIENTQNICEKLSLYEVDIALIEGSVSSSNYDIIHFHQDTMVLAVPFQHPLAKREFSLEELNRQTWISREKGSGTREYLEHFLLENKITAKNIMVFGSNYSIKEAVKNNLGITFLSSMVIENAVTGSEVSVVQTPVEYCRPFSYVQLKGIIPTKATSVFIELLTTYSMSLISDK